MKSTLREKEGTNPIVREDLGGTRGALRAGIRRSRASKILLSAAGSAKRSARLTDMLMLSRPLSPSEAVGAGEGSSPRPLPLGYRLVPLDEEGVEELQRVLPYESGAALAPRLGRGDRCYAALSPAGEVGAFAWLATGPTSLYVYELADEARVPGGVAFVYEVFTFPKARNLGLARGLVCGVIRKLCAERDAGRTGSPRRVEAWVENRNAPSLRVFSKLGFEPYGRWKVAALGPARVLRGDPSIPREVPERSPERGGRGAKALTTTSRRGDKGRG